MMFATTMTGNGDELVDVEVVLVEVVLGDDDEDDEEEVVVEEELALLLLWPPPWTVDTDVDVTVFVTVFVEVFGGGGAGGAVDGAKRLFATEAMPAVTRTTPTVMAARRKLRRGFSL